MLVESVCDAPHKLTEVSALKKSAHTSHSDRMSKLSVTIWNTVEEEAEIACKLQWDRLGAL